MPSRTYVRPPPLSIPFFLNLSSVSLSSLNPPFFFQPTLSQGLKIITHACRIMLSKICHTSEHFKTHQHIFETFAMTLPTQCQNNAEAWPTRVGDSSDKYRKQIHDELEKQTCCVNKSLYVVHERSYRMLKGLKPCCRRYRLGKRVHR